MGRDTDLFKAAKSGNNVFIERAFASYLKRNTGHHVFGSGFGSIRKSANPNIQDDAGYTLVHHATLHGQSETVSLLLKCGASVTIPDSSGSCPLHLAAWKGDLEIVHILVTQGPSRANVNQQSDSDDTALHLASQYGYSDVVDFLLQRHADPLLMNIKGETPLDLASQYGHLDAVHLLISHCPEILQLSRQQFSPLHLAARNGHTVVALSLINAGISVNTVCERGSPLHEAAMCGKTDTVRLLLDKGANLDLLDNKGHTVLHLLAEFTADKAKEIQTMIEEQLESRRSSGLRQLGTRRIVAVAQKACSPLVRESSALAFKKGDTIDVQRMTSKDVFIGSAHGRTGSFLATDVEFFKEQNGRLVTTDVSRVSRNLSVSSSEEDGGGGAEEDQREGEKKDPLVSKRPPYEYIPAFPTEVVTSPSSTTSDQSLFSPSEDQPREIDSDKGAEQSERSGKRPNKPSRAKLSKKEKKFQLQKDDGSYTELQPINPQDAKREFGESLRLNPVGPAFVANRASNSQDTQTHTAHNADQMVVDSSFMGSYYVLEIGNFDESGAEISQPVPDSSTADESPKPENPENPENPELPGSYYMLEVKNFEKENSLEETLTASGEQLVEGKTKRSSSSLSQKSYENLTLSTCAQKKVDEGHYDTPSNVALVVGSPAGRGLTDYVNIEVKSDKKSAQTSAPVNIPIPKIIGENGARLSVSAGSHSSGPSSLPYENIELSSSGRERVVILEGPGSSTLPISIPRQAGNRSPVASSHSSQSSARSYENIDQAFMNKRGSRTSLNVTPGGEKSGSASPAPVGGSSSNRENEGKKKGKRREEIYEAVSIGGKGGSKHKRTRSDPNASPTKAISSHSLFSPERNSPQVGRHSVAVVTADDYSGNVEAVGMNGDGCHGNGVAEGVGEGLNPVDSTDTGAPKGRPVSGGGAKIIENSANPFAGLVMSASKQLEESTQVSRLRWSERKTEAPATNGRYETLSPVNKVDPAPFTRGRAETIWDDDRVEQEWTQIDSLLSDMNISPPLPSSPTHQPHLTSPSHHQPPVAIQHHPSREVFMWLQGLGLGGYASTLESNGFDRLNFLGENVLAMDDLEDIGITNRGEQYTIMAAASLLPPPPQVGHASNLTEWLKLLQLEDLEGKFVEYSLKKLATFWDIELTSVVGIELLGYRKRLQYGIAELRSTHPEWMHEQPRLLASSSLKRTPASSSPIDSISFIKDYRNIRSTASPRTSRIEQPVALVLDQPPSEKWNSRTSQDSQATICESWQQPINFEAKYLGSVVVAKVRGTQSTEEACLRLKTSTENMKKIPQIILAISWKGVKFVDAHTMNVVSTHAIRDISHCSQDIEDKTIFAYITKDHGHNYCHVFMAASTEIADEVVATIGQAFEVAYQKVMKARSERSVSVESTERKEKLQSKHSFQ